MSEVVPENKTEEKPEGEQKPCPVIGCEGKVSFFKMKSQNIKPYQRKEDIIPQFIALHFEAIYKCSKCRYKNNVKSFIRYELPKQNK